MQSVLLSEDGGIGYVMHGCNKQSRRIRACESGNKSSHLKNMERALREFISIGQIVLVLSCQLVLIMFRAVRRQRQRNAYYGNNVTRLETRLLTPYCFLVFDAALHTVWCADSLNLHSLFPWMPQSEHKQRSVSARSRTGDLSRVRRTW